VVAAFIVLVILTIIVAIAVDAGIAGLVFLGGLLLLLLWAWQGGHINRGP